jgi:hypothetical protein
MNRPVIVAKTVPLGIIFLLMPFLMVATAPAAHAQIETCLGQTATNVGTEGD